MILMNNGTLILACNSFCYWAFFYFLFKKRGLDVYSFVWLFYAILSLGSIYLIYIDSVWFFNEITVFPLIYLFVAFFLFLRPLSRYSETKTWNIIMPNEKMMKLLSWAIIVVYFMLLFQMLMTSFSLSDIFNADILANNYDMKTDNIGVDEGKINIWGVLKNVFAEIIWLVFMYNWLRGNKILSIGLLSSLAISIFFAASIGSRGGMFRVFVNLPFVYFIFRNSMTPEMKKSFLIAISVFLFFTIVGFIGLTIGRFGDRVSYSLLDIVVYYASSNFIMFDSYALDANGVRYGDRVFPLVRLLLGLDITGSYVIRREVFSQMTLNDSQFSTFIGDFVLDYGPIWGFMILMLFSFWLSKGMKSKGQYRLSNVLIFSLFFRICVNGYSLFTYSEIDGNLTLLYVLFFYFLFRHFEPKKKLERY